MRKLIMAAALTLVVATTASAAPDSGRDRRSGDTPIVKMVKAVKRGLGIVLHTGIPSVPKP